MASTGDRRADSIVVAIVELFEDSVPHFVRGYYVCGSYADGTAAAHSDLDVDLVTQTVADDRREETARQMTTGLVLASPLVLDLARIPVSDLAHGSHLTLGRASLLVFGHDDRGRVVPPSLERHCRAASEACFSSMLELRPGVNRLRFPLAYPDPSGRYYGYEAPELATVHSAGVPSTRRLVSLACRIGTALLALEHGNIACTKAESVELYDRTARDQWSGLVGEIYGRCKIDWSYRIPDLPHEQEALRRLCRRVLALERHAVERLFTRDS